MSFVGFKRPRGKNNSHLDFIRNLPCVCCGDNIHTEAAHIRSGESLYGKRPTGGAEKPSDLWALPLCGDHHREQHNLQELNFWESYGVNPFVLALSLYACSGDIMTAEEIINRQAGRA